MWARESEREQELERKKERQERDLETPYSKDGGDDSGGPVDGDPSFELRWRCRGWRQRQWQMRRRRRGLVGGRSDNSSR